MTIEPTNVAAVSIKLPPFCPADPEVWFFQVDAQFTTRGITAQKTKFDNVVSSLSAVEVRDLLLKHPEEFPYDTLRAEFIKWTAASKQRNATTCQLGDCKLTQLLRCMSNCWVTALAPQLRLPLYSTNSSYSISQLVSGWFSPPQMPQQTIVSSWTWLTRLWKSPHNLLPLSLAQALTCAILQGGGTPDSPCQVASFTRTFPSRVQSLPLSSQQPPSRLHKRGNWWERGPEH